MIASTCRALSNDERRALWAARYYGGGHAWMRGRYTHSPAPAPAGTHREPGNSTARAPQAGIERPLSEAEHYAWGECLSARLDASLPPF